MKATTTIKVPKELRDRLATRAAHQHTTMASVIERSLDAEEDREFWHAVNEAHAHISEDEYVAAQRDATLSDDLADHADDTIAAQGSW